MNNKRITASDVLDRLVNLRQLTFEVTDACNLNCKYCSYGEFYSGYDKREAKFLDIDLAHTLLDYLIEIWNNNIPLSSNTKTYISFYGGEPLMNVPFIKGVIDYLNEQNLRRRFVYNMTTNAMLLDKYMDFVAEYGIRLLISLDGDERGQSYRETFDGRNSFDKVIHNVELLRSKYPEYFKTSVEFNSVLHNRNSVESAHNFIKSRFGKDTTISELNNSGIRQDKVEEFNATYKNKEESLKEAENYEKLTDELFMNDPGTYDLLLFLHKYSGNVFMNYSDFFVNENSSQHLPTGTCIPFAKKMFVTVNGKIIQCEKIDHRYSLGKVENGLVEMNLDKIADDFNSYLDKLQAQCSVCYRKKSCVQCVFYVPDLNRDNPICKGYMNGDQFQQYTTYCLSCLRDNPKLYRKLMTEVVVE